MPLESSLSDVTISSVTLESSITILEASFDDGDIIMIQATDGVRNYFVYLTILSRPHLSPTF